MITVRPIVHTDNPDGHRRLLAALGAVELEHDEHWTLLQLAGGRIALHPASDEYPAGTVECCLEVDDLTSWAAHRGFTVDEQPWGAQVTVTADDGLRILVSQRVEHSGRASGATSVQPIWVTPDPAAASALLGELGLQPRLHADSGNWHDFTAEDGLAAVHAGRATDVVLGFEYAHQFEPLVRPLTEAGVDPQIIDESYGRSLQVLDPDGDERLWINERQSDLYGYSYG